MQQIGVADPSIARPHILKYGDAALNIDPDHRRSLGHLIYRAFMMDYDFERGIELSLKSLEQNPNNSAERSSLTHYYMIVGDWDKAWEQIQYAKEIGPLNPQVIAFEAIMFINDNKLLSAIKNIEKLSLIDRNSLFVKLTKVFKERDFGSSKRAMVDRPGFFRKVVVQKVRARC